MKVSFAKNPEAPVATAPVAAAPVAAAPAVETIVAAVPTPVAAVAVETVTTIANPVAPAPAGPTITDNSVPAGAVATVPTFAPPAKQTSFYDDESLDAGDLVLPRFNIVQKVGELSNVFPPGSILLNGQLVLAEAGKGTDKSKEIKILVVGFQPTIYTEKVEGGIRGNMFRSEQEVVAANGTLDWNEATATKRTLYQRLATAMILVEQPEGLDAAAFPTTIEGKNYSLALYSMKGTSYTNAAKHFKSARKIGHLRGGYRTGFWTMQSQLKKFSENYAYIPVVKSAGAASPEFQAAVKEILGF